VTTRLLVGDVFERMAELEDHSFDLIVTSPPFLALRSYLPEGHPDKDKEIGSEANPANFLDTMLALTAEWRRLLAPHGSLAVELGDKYSGSGGAGGDYDDGAWRDGQNRFGSVAGRPGWPLEKSLSMLPTLYPACLAYGRNLLTGQPSPAGRWRIRNLKPWIRSNPPVGALGDKERPATSYITVACTGASRWFDLDAVRTPLVRPEMARPRDPKSEANPDSRRGTLGGYTADLSGGAPPLDWWHHVDATIDHEIDQRAREGARHATPPIKHPKVTGNYDAPNPGARGVHIRRALEKAGILTTQDAYDVSPKGYAGAHYAVWPMELVQLMINEMCPTRVCVECGVPSRRIVAAQRSNNGRSAAYQDGREHAGGAFDRVGETNYTTLGWSDCGHGSWRPGRILDPFSGSGTTLAVASGMGRDSVGIDLDPRNAHLTEQRVGMFLEVNWGTREATA
jgi:DNA methylase